MEIKNASIPNSCISGNNLEIFIVTGSLDDPIVTLRENNGYPPVQDFYARPKSYPTDDNLKGIHISIRFNSRPEGGAFILNYAQEGMTPNGHSVIPMD
jgi:hypothetical protein